MANICENELRVFSEEEANLSYISNYLKENLNADVNIEGNNLTAYFSSKCKFPYDIMENMAFELPIENDNSLNMVCLSVEWGNLYTEFNVCNSNDGWYEA